MSSIGVNCTFLLYFMFLILYYIKPPTKRVMWHVFMLQQGYAEKLDVLFQGIDSQMHTPWMGCYGVGTTRCLQALAEQHNDQDGIKWPLVMAPYKYCIVPTVSKQGSIQRQGAEQLFVKMSEKAKR